MAIILNFKLPKNKKAPAIANDKVITSSVNDVMLMIHHALHGSTQDNRPKDNPLAAQLLDELSNHIKKSDNDEIIILSYASSNSIANRYPENIKQINKN